MNTTSATALYFELAPYDRSHREAWQQKLARWQAAAPPGVRLVSAPDEADFIIETLVLQNFTGGRISAVAPDSHYHRRPADTFAWDGQDQPTGRLPGLYCSLPRRIFDVSRHRSFCYPYRYNEFISFAPPGEARHLYGFTGSVTSPLRARIFDRLTPDARSGRTRLRATANIWGQIFAPQSEAAKQSYFDDLRACKFVLCPRGNGVCSVRLFETLEAGRVPVIVSDQYVLPAGLDLEACIVRLPERELDRLPALLAAREPDWPAMAAHARLVWERNFSDRAVLARLATELRTLRARRRADELWMPLLFPPHVLPQLVISRLKRLSATLRTRTGR